LIYIAVHASKPLTYTRTMRSMRACPVFEAPGTGNAYAKRQEA